MRAEKLQTWKKVLRRQPALLFGAVVASVSDVVRDESVLLLLFASAVQLLWYVTLILPVLMFSASSHLIYPVVSCLRLSRYMFATTVVAAAATR